MCDGLHLPYRDGCFDAVLSIAGNGHIQMTVVDFSHSVTNCFLHMHEAQLDAAAVCLKLNEPIITINITLPEACVE